jgi:hypothetical protein
LVVGSADGRDPDAAFLSELDRISH